MDDVIIKKSAIGQFKSIGIDKGVFANRDFEKGEVVIKYELKPLTKRDFENLPAIEKEFTHVHNGQTYLYSLPERYVNHSSKPNTRQDVRNKRDVATRDIKKGEEITTDSTKDDQNMFGAWKNGKGLSRAGLRQEGEPH